MTIVSTADATIAFQTAMTGLKGIHSTKQITPTTLQSLKDTATSFSTGVEGLNQLNAAKPGSVPTKAFTALNFDAQNLNSFTAAATSALAGASSFAVDANTDKQMGTAHADAERAVKLLAGFPSEPTPQVPQTPQEPQAPQEPQTPQTPQEPQTPQTPQTPQQPGDNNGW